MSVNLQDAILEIIYEYYGFHPGSPKMLFSALCDKLFANPSHIQIARVQGELFILQKKGWVDYDLTESGKAGLTWIEPDGIRIAESLQGAASTVETNQLSPDSQEESIRKETEKVKGAKLSDLTIRPYPTTLGELIQRDPICARLIKRDDEIRKIIEYLTQTPEPKPNHIVLYGQPMVGKTKILDCLSKALSDNYVSMMVTGQGLTDLGNLDAFAFDLADQLTNKFQKWAKHSGGTASLKFPHWNDFAEGVGVRAFYAHWENLRHLAGKKQPIVIFDEIEHLLDDEKVNPRIFTFLDGFVRSPENGYFILAGSEQIRHSHIEPFSMLIARGRHVQIHYFSDEVASAVFTATQNYFACEDKALQYFITLCDGHPRILQMTFEAIAAFVSRSPAKQSLETADIEPILAHIIELTNDFLWAMLQRLSDDELNVAWLISRKASSPMLQLEYSLNDLVELAGLHFSSSTIDPDNLRRGIANLEMREWIEYKNRSEELFRFKLGIFPLWLRRHHIKRDEVMR